MQTPGFDAGGPNPPITPPMGTPGTGGGSVNPTLLLVLGVLGILCCNILGPVTWVMSNNALATINAGGAPESERGTVNVTRILGIVGTGILVLSIFWGIFVGMNAARMASQMQRTNPPGQMAPAPAAPQ